PADVRTRSAAAIALQESLAQYVSLQGAPDPTLRIVAPAVPPSSPSSPRPRLTLAIALIAGLLLGCGLAIANHLLRRRLMNEDELISSSRRPVRARIPHMKRREADDYLAGREPLPSDAWEAYRTLRANLLTGLREDDFPRSVLVTSAVAGEGKTMSCVNLAIALAAGGMRGVLVDGDSRRPTLASQASSQTTLRIRCSHRTSSRRMGLMTVFGCFFRTRPMQVSLTFSSPVASGKFLPGSSAKPTSSSSIRRGRPRSPMRWRSRTSWTQS